MSYTWEPSAVHGGGFVNVIAASPSASQTYMVGGDVSGCHITTDRGENWTPAIKGLPNTACLGVASLMWHPSDPDLVFGLFGKGASSGGLYVYSLAQGEWTLVSDAVWGHGGNTSVPGILPRPHPRSTGNLIAWDTTSHYMVVGTYDQGVWRGKVELNGNLETEFTPLAFGPSGGTTNYIRTVAVAGNRLWVGMRRGNAGAPVETKPYYIDNIFTLSASAPVEATTGPRNPEEIAVSGSTVVAVCGGGSDFGVWKTSTTTWVRYNGSTIGGGEWCSIGIGAGNTVYVGCAVPWPHPTLGDNKHRMSVLRCDDITAATATWVTLTVNPTGIHTTMGDSSDQWWLAAANQFVLVGAGSYVAASIAARADGTVLVAGRSGVWRTTNGTAASPDWYPVPRGLGVTINRDVAASDLFANHYVNANTDWVSHSTSDGYDTIVNAKPSPNTCFDVWYHAGSWWAATGDRDANALGKLWMTADPMDPAGWEDTGLNVGGTDGFSGGDNFNRTVAAGGWGTASDGKKWENPVVNGDLLPANAFCNGMSGVISTDVAGNTQISSVLICHPQPVCDGVWRFSFLWDKNCAGNEHTLGFVFRRSGSQRYELRLRQPDPGLPAIGDVFLNLLRQTTVGTKITDSVHGTTDVNLEDHLGLAKSPGTRWNFKVQVTQVDDDMTCGVSVWVDGDPEPEEYSAFFTDATPELSGDGDFGFRVGRQPFYTSETSFYVDNFDWSGASLGNSVGGLRPFGGVTFYDDTGPDNPEGNVVTVVAVADDGIWRQGRANGPWEKADGSPPCTGVTSKAIPMAYGGHGAVFCYDRPRGIWRSLDYGRTWVQIVNANGDQIGGTGGQLTVVDFPGTTKVEKHLYWTGGGFLTHATDPLTCTEWVAGDPTSGIGDGAGGEITLQPVGPLTSLHNFVVVAGTPAFGTYEVKLHLSTDSGVTFTDVATDAYRAVAAFPFDMALDPEGNLAVVLNGNGVSYLPWSGPVPVPVVPTEEPEPEPEPEPPVPGPEAQTARVRMPLHTRKASSLLDYALVDTTLCLYPSPFIFPSLNIYPKC